MSLPPDGWSVPQVMTGQTVLWVICSGLMVVGAVLSDRSPLTAASVTLIAVVSFAWAMGASARGWFLHAALAIVGTAVTIVCFGSAGNLGWFALCIVVGCEALINRPKHTAAVSMCVVAIFSSQWIMFADDAGWGAWIAGTVFTTVVCVLVRRQAELIAQLQAAHVDLAKRSRAEERSHIANEMHDVIGHALTVALLHVAGARLALDEDVSEARGALDRAEAITRQSLKEIRQAVAMLRRPENGTSPLPLAIDVPDLVQSFRQAGQDVDLSISGDVEGLSATTGLTIYRVVQEALTNAARHAPAMRTCVAIEATSSVVHISVHNQLPSGASRQFMKDGTGIPGMRERADAAGGRLTVASDAGSWQVEAILPVSSELSR